MGQKKGASCFQQIRLCRSWHKVSSFQGFRVSDRKLTLPSLSCNLALSFSDFHRESAMLSFEDGDLLVITTDGQRGLLHSEALTNCSIVWCNAIRTAENTNALLFQCTVDVDEAQLVQYLRATIYLSSRYAPS